MGSTTSSGSLVSDLGTWESFEGKGGGLGSTTSSGSLVSDLDTEPWESSEGQGGGLFNNIFRELGRWLGHMGIIR